MGELAEVLAKIREIKGQKPSVLGHALDDRSSSHHIQSAQERREKVVFHEMFSSHHHEMVEDAIGEITTIENNRRLIVPKADIAKKLVIRAIKQTLKTDKATEGTLRLVQKPVVALEKPRHSPKQQKAAQVPKLEQLVKEKVKRPKVAIFPLKRNVNSNAYKQLAKSLAANAQEQTMVLEAAKKVVVGYKMDRTTALLIAQNAHLVENAIPNILGHANVGEHTYLLMESPSRLGMVPKAAHEKTPSIEARHIVSQLAKVHEKGALIGSFELDAVGVGKEGAVFTDLREFTFAQKQDSVVSELFYVLAKMQNERIVSKAHIGSLLHEYLQSGGPRNALEEYFANPLHGERQVQGARKHAVISSYYTSEPAPVGDALLVEKVNAKVARYASILSGLKGRRN